MSSTSCPTTDLLTAIPVMGSKIDEILDLHHAFASTTTSLTRILSDLKTYIATETITRNKMTDGHKSYLQSLSKKDLINIILNLKSNNMTDMPRRRTTKIRVTPPLRENYRMRTKQRRATVADGTAHAQHKNMFTNPHEKSPIKQKATERMATNYDKIHKQRVKIKALKKERKYKNSLKQRIQMGNRKTSQLFSDPHENIGPLSPTGRRGSSNTKYSFPNMEQNTAKKRSKSRSSKKKKRSKSKQKYLQPEMTERETNIHQRLQSATYENSPLQLDGIEELEDEEYIARLDQMEALEDELLKLNMKRLKRKCNKYCISAEGSKMDMIARILQRENNVMNDRLSMEMDEERMLDDVVYDDQDDEKMFMR